MSDYAKRDFAKIFLQKCNTDELQYLDYLSTHPIDRNDPSLTPNQLQVMHYNMLSILIFKRQNQKILLQKLAKSQLDILEQVYSLSYTTDAKIKLGNKLFHDAQEIVKKKTK